MGRIHWMLVLVFCCLVLGCDRFEEEGSFVDDQIASQDRLAEGTFVATALGVENVYLAGKASFRIPVFNRYRLSLDLKMDALGSDQHHLDLGVFLSVDWHRTVEEKAPSRGYANLFLPTVVGLSDNPMPLLVTSGSVNLTEVSEDQVKGTFEVRARAEAGVEGGHGSDPITIVGAFNAK